MSTQNNETGDELVNGEGQENLIEKKKEVILKKSPLDSANWLSRLTFWWVGDFLRLGYQKKSLQLDDLPDISEKENTERCTEIFLESWKKEKNRNKPSVIRATFKSFGHWLFLAGIWKAIFGIFYLFGPFYLLKSILRFVQDSEMEAWKGYCFAVGLMLSQFMVALGHHQHFYIASRMGIQVKAAVSGAIYRKALKLVKVKNMGEIVNLMSNDSQRLMEGCLYFNYIWGGCAECLAIVILLLVEIGYSALPALIALFIFFPLQIKLGKKFTQVRRSTMKITDERVRLMSEIITAIKLVKLYCWEASFAAQVNNVRNKEMKLLKTGAFINAINSAISFAGPVIVVLLAFVIYVFGAKETLTADKTFVVLALFSAMRFPLQLLPLAIRAASESLVAFSRLQSFLLEEEVSDGNSSQVHNNPDTPVQITDGSFSWKLNDPPCLKNINLAVKKGELVAIVGAVGAGKSSLLSSILRETMQNGGSLQISGKTAYCPQQPWILNQSLRDNVTFCAPFNQEKYDSIVDACALRADLNMLQYGDETEIGERGINLSGGQKQRVSLARSVYSDHEIYLLDDPLSAVDQTVGKHIFENCIKGLLKDKTVLFVTHQLQYLSQCGRIVFLKDGTISEQGTYKELMEANGEFAKLMKEYTIPEQAEDNEQEGAPRKKEEKEENKQRSTTKKALDGGQILIKEEDKSSGKVGLKTYLIYASAMTTFGATITFAGYIVAQLFRVACDVWLSNWVDRDDPFGMNSDWFFATLLGSFVVCLNVFILIRGFLFAFFTLKAATNLHNNVFKNVLLAPMEFFDTTPVGRILNRFSKDQDTIDVQLLTSLDQTVLGILVCLSIIALISAVFYWFLLVIFPLSFVYYFLQRYYRVTSREVKRLDGISRSPMYAHLSATLQGLPTLRAYGVQEEFDRKNLRLVDRQNCALMMFWMTARWLGFRLDLISLTVAFASAIFSVSFRGSIAPSLAGLAINYALQMGQIFQWTVRQIAETESYMTSVERIAAYTALVPEGSDLPAVPADDNWPSKGRVSFKNFELRYQKHLPPVLKGVSFEVKPKEKLGIVGRTGAGKSSLTLALFRMIEASGGSIEIDGVDISTISLESLRSKLAIIPQDPVLFIGTIRKNLDPFNHYSEDDLWKTLEQVHMKEAIQELPNGLDTFVTENGENFSLGQRQLICIGRALLRNSKILVLDEATSAVDIETDHLIQKTIRQNFQNCTVLTIAHRLNTIMDSDKVLVLDAGKVAQFGSPAELLKDQTGIFHHLVSETGKASSEHLKNIAFGKTNAFGPKQPQRRKSKKWRKSRKNLLEADAEDFYLFME